MIEDDKLQNSSLYVNDPEYFSQTFLPGPVTYKVIINVGNSYFEFTKIGGVPASVSVYGNGAANALDQLINQLIVIRSKYA